jgi:hypothetical protein
MKDDSGTVILSQSVARWINYLSHFAASGNAVTVEYLQKTVMGKV